MIVRLGLSRWQSGKESSCQCRRCRRCRFDAWSGRSAGEGNGNLLQYSRLGNPVDRGACGPQSLGSQRAGHDRACTRAHSCLVWSCVDWGRGVRWSLTKWSFPHYLTLPSFFQRVLQPIWGSPGLSAETQPRQWGEEPEGTCSFTVCICFSWLILGRGRMSDCITWFQM